MAFDELEKGLQLIYIKLELRGTIKKANPFCRNSDRFLVNTKRD